VTLVKNVCALGDRLVPGVGAVLPGEVAEVPDSVAGFVPGAWAAATQRQLEQRGPTDPLQWRVVPGESEELDVWECRAPGAGLLDQDEVWQPVAAPKVKD
jgi:hypothetical protein